MGAFTSAQTGNWGDIATWTDGSAVPGDGDTATIATGHTVTVATDATVGTSGASGTAAITVQGTGQLIVPTGVTLTCRGDLVQQRGTTVTIVGTLLIDPPAESTYVWVGDDTGSSGNCNFVVNNGSVVGGTRGGVSTIGKTNKLYQNFVLTSAIFENLGTSSVTGASLYAWVNTITVGVYIRGLVVKNCGNLYLGPGNSRPLLDIDGLDIRASKSSVVITVTTSNAKNATATRSIKNLTVFDSASRTIEIFAPDITYSEWVLYNTVITASITATVRNNGERVIYIGTQQGVKFSSIALSGSIYSDFVYFARAGNPHYVQTSNAGSLAATEFSGFMFDADNYKPIDAGDCFIPYGATVIKNPLCINQAGALISALSTTCRATVYHATCHNAFRATVGETAGDDEQLVELRSCLFASQGEGLRQLSAFVSQSAAVISHNAYHDMQTATNLSHPIHADRSYMGAETFDEWYTTGSFDGTAGRGIGDVSANPNFVDPTRTVRKWFGERLGVDTSDPAVWTMDALAAEAVKLNGVDALGDAATPVTDLTPVDCHAWVRAGFAPTNAALLNAGHDGVTIGAMEYVSADDTAPNLTGPTATVTGPTTATASVSTDDGNGTLYFLASTNSTESAAAVKAALSQSVTVAGAQSISLSALDPETTYYVHFVQINGAGLESDVASTNSIITPAIVYPEISATVAASSTSAVSATVTTDTAGGTIYGVLSESATVMEAADIKSGADDSATVTDAGDYTLGETGMATWTQYYWHIVHEDADGLMSNVLVVPVKTLDISIPLAFSDTAPATLLGVQVWSKMPTKADVEGLY